MTARLDEGLHQRMCLALAERGFFDHYARFAERFGYGSERKLPVSLGMPLLTKVVRDQTNDFKALPRWKVMWVALEVINGWTWRGVIVIKSAGVMEVMNEGDNGRLAVGDTLASLASQATRLVPGFIPNPATYLRPYFDGDEGTLRGLVTELLAVFARMNDIIREDLADFPQA